jgi:hypothetical protein
MNYSQNYCDYITYVKAATEAKNTPSPNITIVYKGRGKSAKGLHWEYVGAQR